MQFAQPHAESASIMHPGAGTVVIADDLSGAAECACEFSMAGRPAELRLLPAGQLDEHQVTLWDLDAREIPRGIPDDLVRAMRQSRRTFVKIDSLMRGRWADLVASCVRSSQRPAMMCTALPRLGRGMRNGSIELHPAANGPRQDIDPCAASALDALAGTGLSVGHLPAEAAQGDAIDLERSLRTHDLTVVDAVTEAELAAWATALERRSAPYVAVGAAGLAGALARALGIPRRRQVPPMLPTARAVLVGSRTVRAREQLSCLADALQQSVRWWDPARGFEEAQTTSRARYSAVRIHATTSDPFDQQGGRSLSAGFVQAALAEVGTMGCFVVTGGETARALCDALGVTRLRVLGQVEEGISLARMQGVADEPYLILKSGSFGDREALLRMARLGCDASQEGNT